MIKIQRYKLIGKTIEKLIYIPYKKRLIFVLKNDEEILMKMPNVNYYGNFIDKENIITKNYKYIDYESFKNIKIKDMGWENISNNIIFLFIVDENSDVYRFNCSYNVITGIPDNNLYDYSEYLKRKKIGLRERFNRYIHKYEMIK